MKAEYYMLYEEWVNIEVEKSKIYRFTKEITINEAIQLRKGNTIIKKGEKYQAIGAEIFEDKENYFGSGSTNGTYILLKFNHGYMDVKGKRKDGWSCHKDSGDYRNMNSSDDWDDYYLALIKRQSRYTRKSEDVFKKHLEEIESKWWYKVFGGKL